MVRISCRQSRAPHRFHRPREPKVDLRRQTLVNKGSAVYFAYIFQWVSRDIFYVGVTHDLKQRQHDHIQCLGPSPGVDSFVDLRVFSERYETRTEAVKRALLMKAWDRESMIKALDR